MQIGFYFSPLRIALNPTGVGRHTTCMISKLAGSEGVSGVLLANRHSYANIASRLPSGLAQMPTTLLPGRERLMRFLLQYTRLLPIDRFNNKLDWIYCPKEQPIYTKQARLAVTVHDVVSLENNIPGMPKPSFLKRKRWKATVVQLLARADLILSVSQFTKERILQLFDIPDEKKIIVVGNGVSEQFFRDKGSEDHTVLERYNLDNRSYVLAIGGLSARKGGDTIVKLAQAIKRSNLDTEIIVAGTTHTPKNIAAVEELASFGNPLPIRLLGYVHDHDLSVLLSNSLAFLFPSLYEGFGIPALEAMAAGTPVISSNTTSLPEVVGDAGIVVEPTAISEMLSAITEFARNDQTRQEYIEIGRKRVTKYTWNQCASRALNALKTY